MGQISADGRWLAYVSDETGHAEVYVQPFAGAQRVVAGKWQISSGGGIEPRWNVDSKELFYLGRNEKLMVVDVKTAGTVFERGTPRPLFDYQARRVNPSGDTVYHYTPSPDGKRFLMATDPVSGGEAQQLNVVVNWTTGLKK